MLHTGRPQWCGSAPWENLVSESRGGNQAQRLNRALLECERAVLSLPGVSGVSLGEEQGVPRIIVYVERLRPELRRRIASHYGGVRVRVEVSGAFEAK